MSNPDHLEAVSSATDARYLESNSQKALSGFRLASFSWVVIFLCFRDFSSGWIPCLAVLALVVRRASIATLSGPRIYARDASSCDTGKELCD